MKAILFLVTLLLVGVSTSGCESDGGADTELKSYEHTFNILLKSDSTKFSFAFFDGILEMVTIPTISEDVTLSDSARFELDIETEVREGRAIVDGSVFESWTSDTLLISLDYSSNRIVSADNPSGSKQPSKQPQRTPKTPRLRITSAKVFLPPGASITYIGPLGP